MNRIIKILMDRDDMTEEEATALYKEGHKALMDCVEQGDLSGAEDITYDYFGLEPDYLDDMLF
jgi:hypothetical protein